MNGQIGDEQNWVVTKEQGGDNGTVWESTIGLWTNEQHGHFEGQGLKPHFWGRL